MKKMLRTGKGFSLIEVMIALVLFAVGLLAFAGLEVVALRNATYSKEYGKANHYAQQKVEEMKGMDWDSVSVEGSPETLEGRFTRSWTVTTAEDVKTVAVSVTWVDPSHGTKQVNFQTDLYSPPVVE